MWLAVLDLLQHRHFWVQKAAARALGAALASPALSAALYALPQLPGRAVLRLYTHFEACGGDAGALTQAVKCLVATAEALYDAEVAANGGGLANLGSFHTPAHCDAEAARGPERQAGVEEGSVRDADGETGAPSDNERGARSAAGVEGDMVVDPGDGGDEGFGEEGEEEAWEEEEVVERRPLALTVKGLFKRMGRHAVDRREAVAAVRVGALQWLAAAVRQLGRARLADHGGALVAAAARPLHRIQMGGGLDGEEVRSTPPRGRGAVVGRCQGAGRSLSPACMPRPAMASPRAFGAVRRVRYGFRRFWRSACGGAGCHAVEQRHWHGSRNSCVCIRCIRW